MKKLSNWIIIDGYCATRVIEGTDHTKVENRVAFIEKTPNIRVSTFTKEDDYENWEQGDKGSGGSGDHEELEQYGFYPPSREWCDYRLKEMGYTWDEPCIIIKDCSEEHSMGSSPSEEIYTYTEKKLANKFIKKWNEQQQKLAEEHDFYVKNDDKENCYFGHKSWCYWLEIEESKINIDPDTIF